MALPTSGQISLLQADTEFAISVSGHHLKGYQSKTWFRQSPAPLTGTFSSGQVNLKMLYGMSPDDEWGGGGGGK